MPYFGNQECYSILTTYVAFDVKQFKASFSMKMGVFYIRIFPYINTPDLPALYRSIYGKYNTISISLCYLCIYNKSFRKTLSIEVQKQAFHILFF